MCVFILYFKALDRKGVCKVFFLKQFSICLFLITDIPFTEYNERKKRNLTSQNFRPALHIVTNHVSGEMPVQLWGVCVCVCVHSGACRAVRLGGCLITRAESHVLRGDLGQLQPNPEVSTLVAQCPRSPALVAFIKTLGFRPGCSFPFTWHLLSAGNSFGPKKKMSNFYLLHPHTRACAFPSTV